MTIRPESAPAAETTAPAPITARLVRGSTWVMAARAVVIAISFLSTLLLARWLSPDDYGLVAIATTIVMIVNALTELSLFPALIQHREPEEGHYATAFTMSWMRSTAVGVLLALAAAPIAWIYGDDRLFAVVLTLAGGTALSGFYSPRLVVFARGLVFWQEFLIGVGGKLVYASTTIGVAFIFQSYWAIVCGIVAEQVFGVVISHVLASFRPRMSLTHAREILRFSGWLWISQVITVVNWRLDHLVIGYLLGGRPLGYYTLADNLASMPTREITSPLTKTLFPGFSRIAGDRDRLRRAYVRAQTLVCALALPAGFGFGLVADPMVRLFLGDKWIPAVPIIQILAGTFALQTLSMALGPLATALAETRVVFIRDLRTLLIRIPLALIGYMLGGLMGVVIGRTVGSLIQTVWNMALVRGLIGLGIAEQFAANARSLAGVAVMVAVVGGLETVDPFADDSTALLARLAALVAVGALVYVGTVGGLWLAAGRPAGPEREVVDGLGMVRGALRRRRAG